MKIIALRILSSFILHSRQSCKKSIMNMLGIAHTTKWSQDENKANLCSLNKMKKKKLAFNLLQLSFPINWTSFDWWWEEKKSCKMPLPAELTGEIWISDIVKSLFIRSQALNNCAIDWELVRSMEHKNDKQMRNRRKEGDGWEEKISRF